MDQLSRRDAVYHQLDQISSAFRPSAGSAAAGERAAGQPTSSQVVGSTSTTMNPSTIYLQSPTSPVGTHFGSPPMSPARSLSGNGPLEYLNRVGSSLAGALQNSPLNGASDTLSPRAGSSSLASPYTSLGPLVPPEAQARVQAQPSSTTPSTAAAASTPLVASSSNRSSLELHPNQIQHIHGLQSAAQSTETLPDYTSGSLPTSQAIKYMHSLASPSRKIEVTLESVGTKRHPVYVQDVCPVVAGKVRLRLQGDDNAHELRIRVKGVATTTVMRTQHNSARAIAEEEEFWYAGCTLWTAQTDLKKTAGQDYLDLPFSITIPPMVQPSQRRKAYPMPPSFILTTTRSYDTGGIDSASIRYYVKITLARKGILRPNERLFAPVVYLTRASDLSFLSSARRLALINHSTIPGPAEAPDNWQGRVEEKSVKKGFFSGKKLNYKISVLLPSPLIYGKLESLPYYVRVSSNDNALLSKIDASAVSVQLTQRCVVISHGAPGMQENMVTTGITVPAEEGPASDSDTVRRFKGMLDLSKAPATSFQSYNIEVSYHITCRLLSASSPVDAATTVPIVLVSIPPVARATDPPSRYAPSLHASETDATDLPPSYFDVVEGGQQT